MDALVFFAEEELGAVVVSYGGGQPEIMPTFVKVDGVGYEVMYIEENGQVLVEDLNGRLTPVSVNPEDFLVF